MCSIRFHTLSGLLIFSVFLVSCGTLHIYEDPGKPVFISNEHTAIARDSLVVLSFNIKKSEKIELAIEELKKFQRTTPIDIFLLQEMDEAGVKLIAETFRLNYLYFPIVHYKMRKQDIGNAILAKGTIRKPEKLILPNKKWVNGRKRHATVGEVSSGAGKILVYSVHTETSAMGRRKRMEQFDAILEHAGSQKEYSYIVAGGDFNTLYKKDAGTLIQKFHSAGFHCANDSVVSTSKALFGLIQPKLDYIFVRGFNSVSGGKIDSSEASDHLPVFGVLRDFPAR